MFSRWQLLQHVSMHSKVSAPKNSIRHAACVSFRYKARWPSLWDQCWMISECSIALQTACWRRPAEHYQSYLMTVSFINICPKTL